MEKTKYTRLDTPEKLLEFSKSYLNPDKTPKYSMVAIDTETNGLKYWKDVVVGVSFSFDRHSGYYIPLLDWIPDQDSAKKTKDGTIFTKGAFKCVWSGKIYFEDVSVKEYSPPKFLEKLLELWFFRPAIKIIMHNAPFDILMIKNNFKLDLSKNLHCDTQLLSHCYDENHMRALKSLANTFKSDLGLTDSDVANTEQLDLRESVTRNGGKISKTNFKVWRADPELMTKYAVADTFLTFALYEVLTKRFQKEYTEAHQKWFYEDEVMPLCREVVIPMRERGTTIDVEHFQNLEKSINQKLTELEVEILGELREKKMLEDFEPALSKETIATKRKIIKKIIELEGLNLPTKTSGGVEKESFAKSAILERFEESPHWVWEYLLGNCEIKYSESRLEEIKLDIFREETGRSSEFNIRSRDHLKWLFCDKLGNDPFSLPQTDSSTPEKPSPSLTAEVLETFFKGRYPFVEKLLLFKKLDKLRSTYIEPAVALNEGGVLYMELRQDGTTSGRFNCSGGFNLQTLPKEEDVSSCPACKSSEIRVTKNYQILADIDCSSCKNVTKDIICSSEIKKGFIAPEGYKIVNADYSSLEPRCFSYQSGDDKLKAIYKEGLDIYSKVYCDMMGLKYTDLKKAGMGDKRDSIKPVVLGIPYGARAPQVANLLGLTKTIPIENSDVSAGFKEVLDVEAGKQLRDLYLKTYRNLHNYMTRQEVSAMELGFVETIVGRRRHFEVSTKLKKLLDADHIDYEEFIDVPRKKLSVLNFSNSLNYNNLLELLKQLGISNFDPKKKLRRDWTFIRALFKLELNSAKNFPIQGLAAHITNKGMLEAARAFKKNGLSSWVFLQVHDEISCYAREEEAEKTVELLKIAMETNDFAKKIDIPMVADPVITDNLKGAK